MGNDREQRSENSGKPGQSGKPIGQGDLLENEVVSGSDQDGSKKSVPYGDMDQPGMNPDSDEEEH